MRTQLVLFAFIGFFALNKVKGQTVGYFGGTGPNISSIAEVNSGLTTNGAITLQLSNIPNPTTILPGWTFKVKANGNFVNGGSSIPSQYVSLKFRSVVDGPGGVSGNAVPLTNTEANLISTSQGIITPPTYYIAQSFDIIVQGGSHLLVPTTGTYTASITVSLYNSFGVLVSTNNNISVSFNVSFSNSCSGLSLASYAGATYNFDTYAKTQVGGTVIDGLTVQYTPNVANCSGWSLKVRANGNFVNGTSSISPQYVSLKFRSVSSGSPTAAAIGVTNALVPLSMSDVTLINQSAAAFQAYGYTEHKFDVVIQGGTHLQAVSTNGTYTCPITLSLYNQNNTLVATSTVNLNFQISYINAYNYTITLLNSNIDLTYSGPADFAAGKSVTSTDGLRIVGYSAYDVIVKTTGANLTSGSNTIPVSVLRIESNKPNGRPGITVTTKSLTATDQTLITNLMNNHNYQTVDYTLRYYIPGNTAAVTSAPSGSYSTQVVYTVLPR